MTLALYHNDMSSCAQKVRLMLAEKGLQWESRHLNLRAGEHQQDWYVKLNPRAVVPTLIDGDIVVPESNVINEYLDDRFPDPPLKPADQRCYVGKPLPTLGQQDKLTGATHYGIDFRLPGMAFATMSSTLAGASL